MTVVELRNAIVLLTEAGVKKNQCLKLDQEETRSLFFKCKNEMEEVIRICREKKQEHEKMLLQDKKVEEYIVQFKETLDKKDYLDNRHKVYEVSAKSKKFAEMMANLKEIMERYDDLVQEARITDAEKKYVFKSQWGEVVEIYDYMEDQSAIGVPGAEQEESTKKIEDIFEEISEEISEEKEEVSENKDKSGLVINSKEELDELIERVETYKKEGPKKNRFKGFLKRH